MRFSFFDIVSMAFPLSVVAVGIWLTVRLRGIQIRRLGTALRQTFGRAFEERNRADGITPLQASAAALAGTLGTGNIAGVAAALTSGGPGALFWMWVSGFLGMAVKYGEIVLAVRFRVKRSDGTSAGGPMYYIEKAFRSNGPAIFFAGSCVAASFGIGNLAQSGTAAEAMHSAFGVPAAAAGAVMAVFVFLAINGGMKRIGRLAELLVPFMGILYLAGTFAVLIPRMDELPGVFRLIIADAFSGRAVSGGIMGTAVGKAMKVGIMRGIFTNEAGMGTAPIAHGAADARSPAEEGLWGITEVFLDTIVMCTLTGVVILLSGAEGADGSALTVAAFETFLGRKAAGFIAVSTCFFAFASILCWGGYGEEALKYLAVGKWGTACYRWMYSFAVAAGTVFQQKTVFGISDLLNFLMMLPNLTAIVLLSSTICRETEGTLSKLHKNSA